LEKVPHKTRYGAEKWPTIDVSHATRKKIHAINVAYSQTEFPTSFWSTTGPKFGLMSVWSFPVPSIE